MLFNLSELFTLWPKDFCSLMEYVLQLTSSVNHEDFLFDPLSIYNSVSISYGQMQAIF